MKKKIVMYVYGDITTDARVNRAATALANDYEVILISTNFGKEVKDSCYKNELVGNSKIGMKSLFKNIYNAYKIIKRETPDVVYCHDYYSALLAVLLLGKKYCKRIVYDAHELIIPEPGVKDRRLQFFYLFEKLIIKRVDKVFCASKERGEFMRKHYGLDSIPTPIRNISQLSISKDEKTGEILASLNGFFSRQEPTVVYAGVVTKKRRITELANAVSKLAPKFKLLIVGKGDAVEELKAIASANPQMCMAFTGAVPYRSLGAILSRCDVGFVYYPIDTLNNTYCASNKVYEYASVSLPIISNTNPTIKAELESNNIGVASDDLVSALELVSKDLHRYKQACIAYTSQNPWKDDEDLLLSHVTQLTKI